MTGAARTLDRFEEKSRGTFWDPGPGNVKHEFGKRKGIDTSEGYFAGHEKADEQSALNQAEADKAKATAEAQAAQAAADAAALEKNQASQREAIKCKGRRASIMTSAQGVVDPLGVPGA